MTADHQRIHSSQTAEWYTPARYLDAVRELLGGIDLDPASNAQANEIVRAAHYYTAADDGLAQPWAGRVFLNPPYGSTNGKSNQGLWSARLLADHAAGDVSEAVLLVNAVPGEGWFQPLWAFPICFVRGRIAFYNAAGESTQPTHNNAFVYLGPQVECFDSIFSRFGVVAVQRTPARQQLWLL